MDHKKIVQQWREFEIPETLHRDVNISFDPNFMITISGPRRAGKTYLCFQMMRELFAKGVPEENVLYLNFEDERALGAEAKDLEKLLETFYELSEPDETHEIYLFLDEIQNIRDWDVWARKTHDLRKNVRMVLTGSSSKLLSREISTKLRGRVLNVTLLPLSFREYLEWNNINYDIKTALFSKSKIQVKRAFSKYLKEGGYPVLHVSELPDDKILQEYYQSMMFRDIVERHNVIEIKKLRILADLLFKSVAKELSYNKLANKLNSLGYSVSKNTIIDYISHFEEAYLFFQNIKYEYSVAKQLGSIKKLYCIDNGLLNAVSFRFSDDCGSLLENLVFIELKRRGKEIYYFRKDAECDFLISEKGRVSEAIQVTEELSDENEKRELKGLLSAMGEHDISKGMLLVNEDHEEKRDIQGKKIAIMPVWKWLLSGNI